MIDRAAALASFGDAVRAARALRGISQEALASEIGVHRTYIGGIERGERNVGLVNILRLAEALDVQPGQLFEPAAPPGSS